MSITLSTDEARHRLVSWLGLARMREQGGEAGVRGMLADLRHIQLDPLDVIGTNADLVAMARVPGLARGDVYRHLGPDERGASGSFEHFAKVRCILPPSFFPYYREHTPTVSWSGNDTRAERLPAGVLDAVLDEVRERGPLTSRELADQGRVRKLDWHGWKSTGKAATMALELLWARCAVVVSGKTERGHRLYDVPERALPEFAQAPSGSWGRWALAHRAAAAGLLPVNAGPWWATLSTQRKDGTVPAMVADGELVPVQIEGASRKYLAPAGFLTAEVAEPDERLRLLGPLDPLVWDRSLVQHAFGFEYVWEVYKPAAKRRWGWYVVPLLHRGQLVGRIEARVVDQELQVHGLWWEEGHRPRAALDDALSQHAAACGAESVAWQMGAEKS